MGLRMDFLRVLSFGAVGIRRVEDLLRHRAGHYYAVAEALGKARRDSLGDGGSCLVVPG